MLESPRGVQEVRDEAMYYVSAFKEALLDKFLLHQAAKFDYTAELTGTGNGLEVKCDNVGQLDHNGAEFEVLDTCVCNFLLSWGA